MRLILHYILLICMVLSGCVVQVPSESIDEENTSESLGHLESLMQWKETAVSQNNGETEISNPVYYEWLAYVGESTDDFAAKFPDAALREKAQYFVAKFSDGSHVFAFIGDDGKIENVEYYARFRELSEFSFTKIGETTYYQIFNFDPKFATDAYHSVRVNVAYPLKEGVLVMQFSPPTSGYGQLLEKIDFILNQNLEYDTLLKEYAIDLPFIYPEDKT